MAERGQGGRSRRSTAEIEEDIGGDAVYQGDEEEEEEHEPMWLSETEVAWALELKRAVEAADSGIQHLSDMEYVNYSMVAKGNVNAAISSIKGMQTLKETYQIQDTVEECISTLQASIRHAHTGAAGQDGRAKGRLQG